MSLFPAYAGDNLKNNSEKQSEEWLTNSSFKITPPNVSQNLDSITEQPVDNRHRHSKTEKRKSDNSHSERSSKKGKSQKSRHKHYEQKLDSEDYTIDKSAQRVYLTINTISRPAVSKYKYPNFILGNRDFKKKKSKFKRYYKYSYNTQPKEDKKTEENLNENESKTVQENEETNISKKTFYYNQELGKNPFNVDMWLEYVKFQDTVWIFEKTFKKGSHAKGIRTTADRKLAILEKALTHNPGNVVLLREKLKVYETTYPSDELGSQLKTYVEKDPGNIILWQGYIESTQCSMSHCNTTLVRNMYNDCLNKLHHIRRCSSLEKSLSEEKILTMLYQCGLFLRQSGLFEQMWTLLRLYLVLNLSEKDKDKFKIPSGINDTQLLELEEVILDSKLPLHELWLRVEKLRESCHWLPWTGTEPCEDPQRTVFIDDVSDLIHPITSDGNVFKLTIMVLTLLKIPLLPFRHSTMQQLGLDYVPWSLDTVEMLLPVYYPTLLTDTSKLKILNDIFKLSVGPQYLKTHPGQAEYLEFLVTLMKRCGECLQTTESNAIFIWWLRFEKLLIVLDRDNKIKMPSGRLKKTKTAIKEFLKNNRDNVMYFKEYALIEFELGNIESARNILLTSINMEGNGKSILSIIDEKTRTNLCHLYRTLIETYLADKNNIETNKEKAIYYLIFMVNDTDKEINKALEKYKLIYEELLNTTHKNLTVPEHFLPDFMTDWTICYALLVYLLKTPFESGVIIEKALSALEQSNCDCLWRREILLEWYIGMLYKNCTEKLGEGLFKLFRDTLNRSLIIVPNNMFLLTVASMDQSLSGCVGQTWWQLSNVLLNRGHSLPALFVVLMTSEVMSDRAARWQSDWTGHTENPVQSISPIRNRMLSTFSRLTKNNICTKRCGLVWRLYLQFLYTYCEPEILRKIYYVAVEECPWLKALYIDAAIYIPAELPQVQDLIIEKELRIHVTPEELEILRT